ncbi:MAG: hypothetical protein A2156_11720 [Deltaproteobacteria bacterium RBG_16_48_10]|nr:MAG: hypothetical protein A2156_11720 [Deltaproteobacteria bacterium RBG_16_48_10]
MSWLNFITLNLKNQFFLQDPLSDATKALPNITTPSKKPLPRLISNSGVSISVPNKKPREDPLAFSLLLSP